jgi:hypothetical protein
MPEFLVYHRSTQSHRARIQQDLADACCNIQRISVRQHTFFPAASLSRIPLSILRCQLLCEQFTTLFQFIHFLSCHSLHPPHALPVFFDSSAVYFFLILIEVIIFERIVKFFVLALCVGPIKAFLTILSYPAFQIYCGFQDAYL